MRNIIRQQAEKQLCLFSDFLRESSWFQILNSKKLLVFPQIVICWFFKTIIM